MRDAGREHPGTIAGRLRPAGKVHFLLRPHGEPSERTERLRPEALFRHQAERLHQRHLQLLHADVAFQPQLEEPDGGDGEEVRSLRQRELRLEQPVDSGHVHRHWRLRTRSHPVEPVVLPPVAAQTLRHARIPQETACDHYGDDHRDFCADTGTVREQHGAELPCDGIDAAGGVCVAAGRDSHLAAAARRRRPDTQRVPRLLAADHHRLHRHRVPHRAGAQRVGEHAPAPYPTLLCAVAVERYPSSQQEHPPFGYVLFVYLADGVHRLRGVRLVGLYAVGRTTAHLVDHAVDVRADHHLREPVYPQLRPAPWTGREACHEDVGLSAGGTGGDARAECAVADGERLLGREGVQPERTLLAYLQLPVH